MESQFHEERTDKRALQLSAKSAKRGSQTGNENPAKRAKIDLEVDKNKGQRMEIVSNKSLAEGSNDNMDLIKLGDDTADTAAEEFLVSDVGISDFLVLSKNKG
jgi:hypothetical protein